MVNLDEKKLEQEEVDGSKYRHFLLRDADVPEPSAALHGKVMRRVKRYERRVLIVKTTGFGVLFIASGAGVIVAYVNLMSAAAQSGFFDFASLFFSDFNTAMSNFQDFSFSMLESFPVFSAAFLLVGVIAVVWSAVHFVDDIGQVRANGEIAMG
jgi:hypothetical protein